MKKRVHVIYDVKGWAYYHRATALQKHAPEDYRVTLGSKLPDEGRIKGLHLVLVLPPLVNPPARLTKHAPRCVVIGAINDGWGWRADRVAARRRTYRYLIFNNWEAYLGYGQPPLAYQISNGVDTDVFRETVPLRQRRPRVLWMASKCHQELKGFSLVKSLKGRFRELGLGLDMKLVNSQKPPLTPAEMADWYNTGTVFVVASKADGTPNPALEAAACGTPVVATAVGNMPELIADKHNGVLLPGRTPEAVLKGVQYASKHAQRLSRNMAATITEWSWRRRAARYFDLFDRLIAGVPPGSEWNEQTTPEINSAASARERRRGTDLRPHEPGDGLTGVTAKEMVDSPT